MKDIIKTNVIHVLNMNKPDVSEKVQSQLERMLGINKVKVNNSKGSLTVSYNLKFIDYSHIERKLREIGCPPSNGMFTSIKRGFITFTEKNELGNSKAMAAGNEYNKKK